VSRVAGKVVWVTGGGSGIGEAGAVELAKCGAHVIVSGRRPDSLARVVATITTAGAKAEAMPLDVSDAAAVERTAAAIFARHGRVDILINSAGMNVANRFWKAVTPKGLASVVDANLTGTLYCMAAVLPGMRERRDGLIINISSWAGRYDATFTGPAYNASKHGVVAATATVNMEECVNGIRACVICPGEVATEILRHRPVPPSAEEMARMLQAEHLAATIRFVAEMPATVCLNEIVISPTWNRGYLGLAENKKA
jgi:NADP-dependent 3-hydroxy acid dehydrogenase YdfG